MIEVTINFSSVEAAIVALDKLRAAPAKKATPAPASPAAPSTPAAARTPRKYVRKAKKAEAAPAASQKAKPEEASAPAVNAPKPAAAESTRQPDASSGAASEDEAKSAMEALYDAKGVTVAREVLSRLGAKRVGELLPDQRAAFIAKAKAVIAGDPV